MGKEQELLTEIHEITSLLARRVVGEASKKQFNGSMVTKFNREADKDMLAKLNEAIKFCVDTEVAIVRDAAQFQLNALRAEMTEEWLELLQAEIAIELFDIWKESKENTDDSWDNIKYIDLPEKHKHEYILTADRIISKVITNYNNQLKESRKATKREKSDG